MTKDTDPYIDPRCEDTDETMRLPDLSPTPLPESYERYAHPLAGLVIQEGFFEKTPMKVQIVAVNRNKIPSPMNSMLRMAFCSVAPHMETTVFFALATDGFLTYGMMGDGKPVAVAHVMVTTHLDMTQLNNQYLLKSLSSYLIKGLDCENVPAFRASLENGWTQDGGVWSCALGVCLEVSAEVVESALLLDMARGDHAKAQLAKYFPETPATFDPASALLRFSTDNLEPN